jgi:uncharacterized membrane protein
MQRYDEQDSSADPLALGLGWFSIGLGLAEIVAPDSVARLIGTRPTDRNRTILRSYGAREIAAGIAILSQPDEARWLWTRVAGDAVDLASLGRMMASDNTDRRLAGFATASVLGVTALDILCAMRLGDGSASEPGMRRSRNTVVRQSITVNRSIDEVYAFWRNFANFPRFMAHLDEVTMQGTRSHWVATAPAGMTVEWDAETVESRENERIAWRSLEGSDVQHSGHVHFVRAPGARGTEVRVHLTYIPPGGALGRAIAKLFGADPEQQVRDDLRRFKQIMETGEVTLSEGPGLSRAARPPATAGELGALAGVRE